MARNLDILQFAEDGSQLAAWSTVASPKPTRMDKALLGGWASLYTAFSLQFATEALEILAAGRHGVVLDPFTGAGTSLAAARRLGLSARGVDLDPFSAILARARVAQEPDRQSVDDLIRAASEEVSSAWQPGSVAESLYNGRDLAFAGALLQAIGQRTGLDGPSAIHAVLEDCQRQHETEAVLLGSLLLAANHAANVVRGSNPVWLRPALQGEIDDRQPLAVLTLAAAQHLMKLTDANFCDFKGGTTRVSWGDARSLPAEDASVDFVLTSPPYLNRLDYIISHYPAIVLVSSVLGIDIDALRSKMIGTTKIVSKHADSHALGRISRGILNTIAEHHSEASQRYYYWTYFQYFTAMQSVFEEIGRVLKPAGHGALVFQDSFYKDVPIPVSELFTEMATTAGLNSAIVRQQKVRFHMGRLSPRQKKHHSQKILVESVMRLHKSRNAQ